MSKIVMPSTPHTTQAIPRAHAKTALFSQRYGYTKKSPILGNTVAEILWDEAGSSKPSKYPLKFPKQTGYSALYDLEYDADKILNEPVLIEPNDYIHIMAYIKNLGDINVSYILNNMPQYMRIYNESFDSISNHSHELIASKCLIKLYATNFYNKIHGFEYNLPNIYSKKMKQLEESLINYFNQFNKKE